MKKLLSFFFLLLLTIASFAELKDLTINADKVSVEREKHQIEAEGSVEVSYRDVVLHGNHLVYNTSTETFHADRGFSLLYGGTTLEGDVLDYDLNGQIGSATQVNFLFNGVRLGGAWLKFQPNEYELKNANFTTCDLVQPHYHVTAGELILYPDYGWMVAYWSYFWLWQIPVVPMPTYIYDFRAREHAQKNLPPFPVVGSDPDNGSYITETLAWNYRRELSGTYSLSYFANKGFSLGVQANYILNDYNDGNFRLNWNPKDGNYGGLTHIYSFGPEVDPAGATPYESFLSPVSHQFELEGTLASKERINYQRVSLKPDLILRARQLAIGNLAKCDLEVNGGRVAEVGNTQLDRAGGKLKVYQDFHGHLFDTVTPALSLDNTYYSNGSRWVKSSAEIGLSKEYSKDVSLRLSYLHYLFIDGQSPFNYELYRYRAADLLSSAVMFKLGETEARLAAAYYLDNWTPQDIDYTLFFKLHCYNLEVTYRSTRGEFNLGFSLASR